MGLIAALNFTEGISKSKIAIMKLLLLTALAAVAMAEPEAEAGYYGLGYGYGHQLNWPGYYGHGFSSTCWGCRVKDPLRLMPNLDILVMVLDITVTPMVTDSVLTGLVLLHTLVMLPLSLTEAPKV